MEVSSFFAIIEPSRVCWTTLRFTETRLGGMLDAIVVVKLAMVTGVMLDRGCNTRLGLERYRDKRQSINTLRRFEDEDERIYERETKRRASILQQATMSPSKVD